MSRSAVTARDAVSQRSPRRGGVRVGDALSRLPSGHRPGLPAGSCGSVVEISCHSLNSLFGMMDFLMQIGTGVYGGNVVPKRNEQK